MSDHREHVAAVEPGPYLQFDPDTCSPGIINRSKIVFFSDFQPRSDTTNSFGFVAQPGPRIMDCMIAAAAEMALADGRAQAVEYRGLLNFLKRTNLRVSYSRSAVLERFATEIDRIAVRDAFVAEPDWQDMANKLRPVAGMETARLVAAAAAYVAEADGVIHPREIDLLRTLRETLEGAPANSPTQ